MASAPLDVSAEHLGIRLLKCPQFSHPEKLPFQRKNFMVSRTLKSLTCVMCILDKLISGRTGIKL